MKNAKLLVLSLVAVASLGLTGCNSNGSSSEASNSVVNSSSSQVANSSSADNSSAPSSASQSSAASQSSTSVQTYVIFVQTVDHISVVADKQLAACGEVVTLTINVDAGYKLKSITVNGTPITGNTFTMPAGSAYVLPSIEQIDISKGVYLTGDVNEQLTVDATTGIYSVKNVKLTRDSNVCYSVDGTELSVIKINNSKTFADIKVPSSNKAGFTLAGGVTYDFYYDPSDTETPCYVKRVNIDVLPQTDKALETLFAGTVGSETCVFPEGVTKVEYTSTERQDDYVWELYSDNSSFASVKNKTTNKQKGYVYRSIDDGVYSIVDTYVENHSGHCITYTERDDNKKFSKKYDIVSNVKNEKYEMTLDQAKVEANTYSHTMQSIDFDIMYCYRTGFSNAAADDIYTKDIKVNSVETATGFTTTVKTWVSCVKNGTHSAVDASYHNEFDVTLEFTKAGALVSVDYTEQNYTETQYDFSKEKFRTGGKDEPVSEKYVTCKYTYGTAKQGKPTFDTTPYFITSINDTKVVNSKGEAATIVRGDSVELMSISADKSDYVAEGKKYIEWSFLPETALDYDQYGITASSNTQAIYNRDNNPVLWPYQWEGNKSGTTDLTISNHTKNSGISKTVSVTVPEQTGNIKSVWAYTVNQYNHDRWTSARGAIYAGATDKVKLCATLTSNNYDQHPDVTVSSNRPDLVTVTYNVTDGYMYIDATKAVGITSNTDVTITIQASYADGCGPSKLTLTIQPAEHIVSDIVGEWNFVNAGNGFNATMEFKADGTGTISAVDETDTYLVTFNYTFDAGQQKITPSNIKVTKNNASFGYSSSLVFDIDSVNTGYIGVYCGITTEQGYDDSGNATMKIFQLFGSSEDDEEGYESTYQFEDFSPKAA